MEKMRFEQKRLLEEFGQNKAVLDAVDLKEQEKIMNQIERETPKDFYIRYLHKTTFELFKYLYYKRI